MRRSVFNVIVALMTVFYIVCLLIDNSGFKYVAIAAKTGTYAEKYAHAHNIECVGIRDSSKDYFDDEYETFQYHLEDDEVFIDKYNGIDDDIVIPHKIGGKEVVGLSNEFMESCKAKEIYIPQSVIYIDGDQKEGTKLYCYESSPIFKKNKKSKKYDIIRITKTDGIYFENGDIPFVYTNNNGSIEITESLADGRYVIIPANIDGYPVETVSFDMYGRYKMAFFPETVKSIKGKMYDWEFNKIFRVEVIFSLIALALILLMVNVLIPKSRQKYALSRIQMGVSILYLIIQFAFSLYTVKRGTINAAASLWISLAMLAAYCSIMFAIKTMEVRRIRKRMEMKQQIAEMDGIRRYAYYTLDDTGDVETDELIKKLKDRIMSGEIHIKTKELEEEILEYFKELQTAISQRNIIKVREVCKKISDLIKKE